MLTAWLCATLAYTASCTRPHQPSGEARRIISLAPSITESLYALGLGDRVVGVTTYCRYPPATTSVEKVGGYTDANLEQLLALRPD